MGWTPRCVGDNNSLDHQFLSRLYICGSIYERIDNAIITLSDLSPDLSDESFVSQALTDPEDGQDQNEDNDGKGLRDLIELLEEKSGVGKRIRSLLPSCPQCKSLMNNTMTPSVVDWTDEGFSTHWTEVLWSQKVMTPIERIVFLL